MNHTLKHFQEQQELTFRPKMRNDKESGRFGTLTQVQGAFALVAASGALLALLAPAPAHAGDPGRDDRPPAAQAHTAGVVYQMATPYTPPPAPVETYAYEMAPAPVQGSVYTAPVYEPPLYEPPVYQAPAPIYTPPPENTYDTGRYGGNAEFGHAPASACGGVLHGEKCLVVIDDHIRRIRLPRPAATVVVGNPAIADVTVLGKQTLFVSARATGSTNLIILDDNDDLIDSYEVYVRTSEIKRVTLRNGLSRETYQCAPNCERTLNPADTPDAHSSFASIISTETSIDQAALGLQSGSNPNTDAQELLAGAQAAAVGAAASGAPGPALPPSGGGLPADLQALVAATGFLGGGQGGAPAAAAPAAAAQAPQQQQPAAQPQQQQIPPALLDAFGQMMR